MLNVKAQVNIAHTATATASTCNSEDCSSHHNIEEYDFKREDFSKSLGLKVYRITVNNFMQNMYNVMLGLENFIIENYGVI
ncbi:MAG: hypothetical protein ACOYMA_17035 [Bacteroidia bacterium]